MLQPTKIIMQQIDCNIIHLSNTKIDLDNKLQML